MWVHVGESVVFRPKASGLKQVTPLCADPRAWHLQLRVSSRSCPGSGVQVKGIHTSLCCQVSVMGEISMQPAPGPLTWVWGLEKYVE